ncbi:MAG TPA: GDSL-type esterase/lipase family protein [Parafilimonas sp.]|nr:GDSL-type esterase/lipase family protein [Parafilimonas sp.]
MTIITKLVWIFLFTGVFLLMSFLKDSRSKARKVIFFGDSITQAGVQPGGYISLLKDMLAKQGITEYDLVGEGIGGNKVYDLYLRMPEDVIAQSPDIVVIWVGVNDVWHKSSYGTGTDADKFEKFYRAIIKQLQANNIKVMLVTPAVIGEKNDYSNQQDGDLNKYSQIIRNIAKDSSLPVCDLHSLFHLYEVNSNLTNADKGILTTDGVHLNQTGNKFVAEEMWKVLKEIK